MAFLTILAVVVALLVSWLRRSTRAAYPPRTVGFLHAPSGAGGGGERVLWVAVDQLQRADARRGVAREYVVFTTAYGGESLDRDTALLQLIDSQFHIRPPRPVKFVYLRGSAARWLSADCYPRLTLLLQTVVGGLALFYEAAIVNRATPIVLETVGVPMVYPLLRCLCGCQVVSYTHFPIVSSSMMERVRAGTISTTNRGAVVTNSTLRLAKLVYYQAFAIFYRLLGQFPAVVFTNSSWTQGHVSELFWPRVTTVLFPPCDVADFAARSLLSGKRTDSIVSVGQFRPEKNHALQLSAFHRAIGTGRLPPTARLVMLGGARGPEDRARADAIVAEARSLAISDRVEVVVNASFDAVVAHLTSGCVGLHAMLDEHFGIAVLEYLAAGIVPLAHNSGGVRLDIIESPDVGYLAATEEEFAEGMIAICAMRRDAPDQYREFQQRGAAHVATFSDAAFGEHLCEKLGPLLYQGH